MEQFLTMFIQFIKNILSLFDNVVFQIYNIDVSLLSIIVAFMVTGFVVTIYWKGART